MKTIEDQGETQRRVIEELGEKQVDVLRLKSLQVSKYPNIFLKMEIVNEIKQVREFGGKVVKKLALINRCKNENKLPSL